MSVKKFRFVSPGIFINEIDNSQLPKEAGPIGPVIIGRTARGPGMRPVQVDSFSEFVETFGNPIPGGQGGDIWRDGNYTAPAYAGYAAQAWLRNSTPCTVVRLLGNHHPDKTSGGTNAGWKAAKAWGLFVASATAGGTDDVAGTGTVSIVDNTEASLLGDTVTIITPANTIIVATCISGVNSGGGGVAPSFQRGSTAILTAANLAAVLTGHPELTAVQGTSPSDHIVTITMANAGSGSSVVTRDVAAGSGAINITVSYADGSTGVEGSHGALAAVVYVDEATTQIGLSGRNQADNGNITSEDGDKSYATGQWVLSQGKEFEFKINVGGKNHSVNFSRDSRKFIRNILNTNPTLTNSAITSTDAQESYFLGETYERHLENIVSYSLAGTTKKGAMAVLLPLDSSDTSGTFDKHLMELEAQAPQTPWIFSQHTGEHGDHKVAATTGKYVSGVTNLFKLVGLDDGAWASSNLKVSIADIKVSDIEADPYGTFTVGLRKVGDTDAAPEYVERYTNCNLNPNSNNFISRKIGDMRTTWDYDESRYRTLGQWPNASRFVRVELNPEVEAATTSAALLPFGFYGAASPRTIVTSDDCVDIMTAANNVDVDANSSTTTTIGAAFGTQNVSDALSSITPLSPFLTALTGNGLIKLVFPSYSGQIDSSGQGLSNGKQTYFGISFQRDEAGSRTFCPTNQDLAKPYSQGHPYGVGRTDMAFPSIFTKNGVYKDATDAYFSAGTSNEATAKAAGDFQTTSQVSAFTLDDLIMKDVGAGSSLQKSSQHVGWYPGARFSGASISVRGTDDAEYALEAASSGTGSKPGTYKDVLEHGYDKFTLPLLGGFDGLDVHEKEPFRNQDVLGGSGVSETTHYAYNSVKRAIQAIADPEVVEMNLAVMPGITNEGLTSQLIDICESRGDALAIIDLKGDYVPSTENTSSESARLPSVKDVVTNLKNRAINSSYGCAYFPWVQIKDTISDSILWSPPSVVALGTMASSQRTSELWFAPAGFNRGGLTEGSAGVPVLQARRRLTSKDRDKLYETNINPIASFPSEGIVIFGQKTLQVTPSALDRINVRRLLIFLKKEISTISAGILFDNNVPSTWHRFTSQVEPFLASVKNRFGLSDFKVVLDETTTTPDLVDRNILYAKIMLKPARAIEFIAIDFVITRSGASFDD